MSAVSTILCVDDEPNVLRSLERLLRGRSLRVLTAAGGAEALEVMARESVDVLLSDMRMPDMDGAQLLAIAHARWPGTVRLLLTGHADHRDTVRSINAGKVSGYLSKPWDADTLLAAIGAATELAQLTRTKARLEAENLAQSEALRSLNARLEARVEERTAELQHAQTRIKRNYMASIRAFANLIELRGGQLIGHGRRVADLARLIAVAMECSDDDVQRVVVAGLLHDIGLIGLPDVALSRPVASLDANLQGLHHRHAALGEQSLLALDDLQPVAALIRSHHERFDGRGFPDGLAGEAIELGARILAAADVYDELLSGAFGLPCMAPQAVREQMLRGRGTRFDPAVVDALLRVTRPQADSSQPVALTAIGWARLEAGMELGADLRSRDGALLLSSDHLLSTDMIERVYAYARREDTGLKLQIKSASVAALRAAHGIRSAS